MEEYLHRSIRKVNGGVGNGVCQISKVMKVVKAMSSEDGSMLNRGLDPLFG